MDIPSKFDSIRPFTPEELPAVFQRLAQNAQFRSVVAYLYPGIPFEAIAAKMMLCKTSMDFQMAFCYDFLGKLLAERSAGCDIDVTALDTAGRYTFVSNHRDIVLDSALLSRLLYDARFGTSCEIAIGDNLLSLPWVKDLVRINKSFIVERSLSMREMLMASRRLSEYMHFVIAEKHDNVWIAQREGRAKDSDDRTQEAILKMMAMGGTGSVVERLQSLHIVPLAISYEYDPCDYLKAAELQQRRDDPHWRKGPTDDVVSMQTGIMGRKGHIHYEAAPCIDTWLGQLPTDTAKTEIFGLIARHIDGEIHRRYRLYPGNWVATDLLRGDARQASRYTQEERDTFVKYLESRLALIDIPHRDEDFLRRKMLEMYANPALNCLAAR